MSLKLFRLLGNSDVHSFTLAFLYMISIFINNFKCFTLMFLSFCDMFIACSAILWHLVKSMICFKEATLFF